MKNQNYFKIIFNMILVAGLFIVGLNACQDSGGRKPINKARSGKNQKPLVPLASNSPVPVQPQVAPQYMSPQMSASAGDLKIDDYNPEKIQVQPLEIEMLVKNFAEISHNFQEAWSISIVTPKQQPNNIFEFAKIKLASTNLLTKIEDKKISCNEPVPYISKQKNNKIESKLLFRFGIFDCRQQVEKELMLISFDSVDSTYKISWNYDPINEYIKVGVLQFMNGIKPECLVRWNVNSQSLDQMNCSDMGQAFEVKGYQNTSRLFKNISIENANSSLKLEWADFGMKDSGESIEVENSSKTAEKSISNKIYICPPVKARPVPTLNCEDYYEKCESKTANKADPICAIASQVKTQDEALPPVVKPAAPTAPVLPQVPTAQVVPSQQDANLIQSKLVPSGNEERGKLQQSQEVPVVNDDSAHPVPLRQLNNQGGQAEQLQSEVVEQPAEGS